MLASARAARLPRAGSTRPSSARASALPENAPGESPVDWAASVELFGGLLSRLADVMGGAALHSLMRYASQEEGVRVASKVPRQEPEAALRDAARLLHLTAETSRTPDGTLRVRIQAPPYLRLAKGGVTGLIVGLFEGVLTETLQTRTQATREPEIGPDGVLRLEFRG